MRDRPGDPVLAEEQRMLPRPAEPAPSVAGYPSWSAEQVVKLPPIRRFPDGARRDPSCFRQSCATGGTGLDRVVSLRCYRLLMVLLAGGYSRVVLRPGQLVGQDFSLVVAGATLAVAAVFQLPAAASSGWWTGASTGVATTPADDRPMLESERITWPEENR